MVKINAVPRDCAGMTLPQLLAADGYDTKRLAVEKNGEIVPKSQYDKTVLQDGDYLEVVRFVGGG